MTSKKSKVSNVPLMQNKLTMNDLEDWKKLKDEKYSSQIKEKLDLLKYIIDNESYELLDESINKKSLIEYKNSYEKTWNTKYTFWNSIRGYYAHLMKLYLKYDYVIDSNDVECSRIEILIMLLMEKKYKITSNGFVSIMSSISANPYYKKHINDSKMLFILKNNKIDYNDIMLKYLIDFGFENCVKFLVLDKKIKINDELMKLCIKKNINVTDELFSDFVFDKKHLSAAILAKNESLIEYLVSKNIKVDDDLYEIYVENIKNIKEDHFSKIIFDSEHFCTAIKSCNNSMIDYLISKNIKVSDEMFKIYYEINNNDNILKTIYKKDTKYEPLWDYLINNSEFSQFHLQLGVENIDSEMIYACYSAKVLLNPQYSSVIDNIIINLQKRIINKVFSSYKMNTTDIKYLKSDMSTHFTEKIDEILRLLVSNGYRLTEEQIINITDMNIKINRDLIKYYKPTEKFYTKCQLKELIEEPEIETKKKKQKSKK
jgi:hypothetical protein